MVLKCFTYNQHFVAMMNIINMARLNSPKEGHKHHIIPKCWFNMNNLPIDNSKDNLVLLSYENHVKVHKLAYLCTTGKMKRNMAYAYHRLTKGQIVANGCFNGENNPFYGKTHSEEVRKKLSEVNKGRIPWDKDKKREPFSRYTRRKMSESHKGKHPSEETRKKLSESLKYRTVTDDTRRKISEALKGKPTWNKGKNLSEETKQKLSESLKGQNIGTHWYNDGKVNMRAYTCPEGFVKGKLNHGE